VVQQLREAFPEAIYRYKILDHDSIFDAMSSLS
jgi:hypothetical protein